MMLIVLGVLVFVAGLVFYEAPEWLRQQYVKGARRRGEQPRRRVDWQARERRIGQAFLVVGTALIVLGALFDALVLDFVAVIVVFALVAWRMFSFLGG